MAFRAVPDHPKFTRLKRRLKLGRFQALGLLESLWHFTAKFCPTGDIGRFSDTDIEDWIEWDGTPGDAVKALVESRWIDENEECRLYVHDWHEFSDDSTDNALARHAKRYANGKAPRMRRLGKEERALRMLRYAELCDSVRTEQHASAHSDALPDTSNQKKELSAVVDGSFSYFCTLMKKDPKRYTLTKVRKEKALMRIGERMKANEGDLQAVKREIATCIRNLAASDFHRTNGHTDWTEQIFRSADEFEKRLNWTAPQPQHTEPRRIIYTDPETFNA